MSNTEHLKKIQEIYIAYYGRPADPEGLEAWATVLEGAGGDINAIIDNFATSPEAEARFGGLSSTEMITQLYNQLFGRNPESQEILDAWVFQLENNPNVTAQSIAMDLMNGALNHDAATVANRLAVAQAFTEELVSTDTTYAYAGNDAATVAANWLEGINADSDITNQSDSIAQLIEDLREASPFKVLFPTDLDGQNGFVLKGIDEGDRAGTAVSNAGDINGDGIDDLLVGAPGATPNGVTSGEIYVVFGGESFTDIEFPLANLDGSNGFKIHGVGELFTSGRVFSNTGDINGDGVDDLLINSEELGGYDSPRISKNHVIFGHEGLWETEIELTDLDGQNGFVINSISNGDNAGRSLSNAGDINGDGFDDIVIGAPVADPNGTNSGQSYVIFGHGGAWGAEFELSDLDGSNGFALNGSSSEDFSGFSISGAGDINGDGLDDLLIGAPQANPNVPNSGVSHVVFGKAGSWDPYIELSDLDGSNGFTLIGIDNGDGTGGSVSNAGDINGDGFDDLLVGVFGGGGLQDSGVSYVVFGGGGSWDSEIELSSLDGDNGFTILGANAWDQLGFPVSSAGDFNGDGFDDILIGAIKPYEVAAEAYLIYGHGDNWAPQLMIADLNRDSGFTFKGVIGGYQGYNFISNAGDINKDGFDDLVIGAEGLPQDAEVEGESYVIFGTDMFGFL